MPAIIDSHVHFWQPARLRYEWLADLPAINRPHQPAELSRAAAGLDLQQIVFVQADCAPEEGLKEVAWVSELAQNEPRIQAIVAFAPLEHEAEMPAYLEQLARFPLVKGVRRLIQSEGPGFAIRPNFIRAVQRLAEFNFSFDICIIHHQLAEVRQLVAACPDVSFVLDHGGKPNIKENSQEPWLTDLTRLAEYANVSCKLSGLVTEADGSAWRPEALKPYIDHVLTVFGPDRVMFGSDWPVVELAATYQQWVQTAIWAVSHLSPQDQAHIFSHNAARFYRLG